MSATENLINLGKNIDHQRFLGIDDEYEFREFDADAGQIIIVSGDWQCVFREGNTFLYRREKPSRSGNTVS